MVEKSGPAALRTWQAAVEEILRLDGPDLTLRQTAVMLAVYLEGGLPTVRGLAARLGIGKPAVTRALDRLEGLGFVRRRTDTRDKRSIIVHRTVTGSVFLAELADSVAGRRAGGATGD